MIKGALKIFWRPGGKDFVTIDPRMSEDRKTFILRLETNARANWFQFMKDISQYAQSEIERIGAVESSQNH